MLALYLLSHLSGFTSLPIKKQGSAGEREQAYKSQKLKTIVSNIHQLAFSGSCLMYKESIRSIQLFPDLRVTGF